MTAVDTREPSRPYRSGSGPARRAGTGHRRGRSRSPNRVLVLFSDRLWPTIALFSVLAVSATLANSGSSYIGDSRFEQFFNPARRVAKSLTIWDGSRGLGRVREDFWPGTTIPIAALRGIGFSPIMAEHLWHSFLLVLVGVGMVQVLRLFRPKIGIEHLVAGLACMFGAYSASFLTPFSNLYFQFAVGPWLIVAFYRGLHSAHPWRWAGVFALLVLSPGNVDTPGLIYNMVPLVAVSMYVLAVERTVGPRHFAGWAARAGLLSVLANAVIIAKIWVGSANYGQRLNDTESVDISFFTSSWPESMRGLGNWLSYFRNGGQLLKPQGAAYFNNWLIVLCTFVPVCTALLVVWLSSWRPRIMFATIILLSLVVLVGAYPLNDPSPLGNQVYKAFANIPIFMAFRNTYKIGAGLAIGVSALFGYGVSASYQRVRRIDRQLAMAPIAVALVAIIGTGYPFWSASLYNPDQQFTAIPTYWRDSFNWIDAQPDTDRMLILPPTSRTRYRWGWVGDDMFDALVDRPHAVATGVPLSTPYSANLIEVVSFGAADPAYRQGTLAPVLRRLGMTRIVLRNDLDWKALKRPRPSLYEGLRHDPELERVAEFGTPGDNTTDPTDTSRDAELERRLPPVEVFAVRDPMPGGTRLVETGSPLVVSGDGGAFPELAAAGLLPRDGAPVIYSGALSADDIRKWLTSGSGLVVTDTNRRRLRVMLSYEPDYSYTLAEGQRLDRVPQQLFPAGEPSQSVQWFKDASTESSNVTPRGIDGSQPWNRPSNAFDADPTTSFTMRRTDITEGRTALRVELREPKPVARVHIDIANVVGTSDGIVAGVLVFSDGSTVTLDLTKGQVQGPQPVRSYDLEFPSRTTTSIELRITKVTGTAQNFGIAEIDFPGLDLTEAIEVPDDVAVAAASDPTVGAALEHQPITYLFSRARGTGPVDEETALRRRFKVVGERDYEVTGSVRVRRGVSDDAITKLIGGPVTATGARRYDGDPEGWGGFAVDGDMSTGWAAASRVGEELTVAFPSQEVRSVVVGSGDQGGAPISRFDLEIAGQHHSLEVQEWKPCPAGGEAGGCRLGRVEIPPTTADHFTLRVAELGSGGGGATRIHVDEVRINDQPNSVSTGGWRSRELGECTDIGLRLSNQLGEMQPLKVRVHGRAADLLDGKPLSFDSCEPVHMAAGWHLVDSGPATAVEWMGLETADTHQQVSARGIEHLPTDQQSATRVMSEVGDRSGLLIFTQSWDRGWGASSGGHDLGRAIPLDTLDGWAIEPGSGPTVELRYRPQLIFAAALAISAGGVALCVVLAAPSRRRRWRVGGVPDG